MLYPRFLSICNYANKFTQIYTKRCISLKNNVLKFERNKLRCYSSSADSRGNEWKDGAVIYSTSTASKHNINNSFGFQKAKDESQPLRALVLGSTVMVILLYFCFIREDEVNDLTNVDMSAFFNQNTNEEKSAEVVEGIKS